MKQHGRPSASSLTLVPPARRPPPAPPRHLSRAAQAIWKDVVAAEAPGHFERSGMLLLLESFCTAVDRSRVFEREMTKLYKIGADLDDVVKLSKAIDSCSARIASLAVKLKLAPAARERLGLGDGPLRSAYDLMGRDHDG
jgi:phage terminase small subunit